MQLKNSVNVFCPQVTKAYKTDHLSPL